MVGQNLSVLDCVKGVPYKGTPSKGYFYACRYPEGWELEFFRTSDYATVWFPNATSWWSKEVADKVATRWARHLNVPSRGLFLKMGGLSRGFPHGLVTGGKVTAQGSVLLGDETLKAAVHRAFGLEQQTPWMDEDESAAALAAKEEIQILLGIKDD